ncbi:PRTRC system protein C [Aquimonas sp.]|uniref:PRTRC system protein C n=1 Tax=Aquimonas sp. TaxID=1872588 RepID=UPI0037BFCFE8
MNPHSVTTLTRKFKLGATVLDDPAPHLPPMQALHLYLPNYPFLAAATLSDPQVDGDCLVYTARKPEVHTKGSWGTP